MKIFLQVFLSVFGLLFSQSVFSQITGTVYRDFNFNGIKEATNPIEPGVGGVTVTAYNSANTVVATTTTSAAGIYSLTVGAIAVRIEFTGLAAGDNSARNATTGTNPNGTNVQFTTGPAATVDYAISYADNYSADLNPKLVTPQQVSGDPTNATNPSGLKIFDYTANVTNSGTMPGNLATKAQIGSNWGVAYDKYRKVVYSAAFLKRFVGLREGLATNPLGAIYKINSDGTSFGLWTELATPGTIGTNSARGVNVAPGTAQNDPTTYGSIAKIGLGDIDIDENATFLYAVNLNTKSIVKIPINTDGTAGTATTYAIPTSGITASTVSTDDLRPFALKFYRGKLYVGVVFSAETSPNNTAANLAAAIYVFDPATNTFSSTPFYQMKLNYNRGVVYTNPAGLNAAFRPWSDVWSSATQAAVGSAFYYNPQPVLSDIEFDVDGSMILGFFDRFGHQVSGNNHGQPGVATTALVYSGGDIIRVQNTSGVFSTPNLNFPPTVGVAEFYNDNANVFSAGSGVHQETIVGGLALLAGTDEVISTVYDPIDAIQVGANRFNQGGTVKYSNSTAGVQPVLAKRNQVFLDTDPGAALKGNGLGDLELLTALEPLEVGNRIWFDDNANGIQDAGETTTVATGTTVTLRSPGVDGIYGNGDDQTWTTTTDANGNYYFSTLSSADNRKPASWTGVGSTVLPGYDYRVEVAIPTNYTVTLNDIGASDLIDNDAVKSGTNAIVSFNTGNTNHNFDIGFFIPNSLGNKVWRDDNSNGTQDAGEPGVAGVSVTLYANGPDGNPGTSDDIIVGSTTTDAYGNYLFSNLPDGNYNVKFTLPSNYSFTQQGYTGNPAGDNQNNTNSDPSTTTGRTGTINLTAGTTGENDLTIDAGIIFTQPTALSSIGDKVWYDSNGDGVQDVGEAGVAGVTVTLYDAATGNILAITKTDANGNYIFKDLANGNYQVGFTPLPGTLLTQNNGGTTTGNATTNSDADPVWGRTGTINIAAAGTVITGIDAGLKDDPKASLGDYVWNDLNANGIQDAGEPGVPGVAMALYFVGADGVPGGGDDVLIQRDTTDANGYYLFSNLDPNVYFVTATMPSGYSVTTKDAGTNDYKDSDFGANVNYPGFQTSGTYSLLTGQNYLGVDMGIKNNTAGLGSLGDKVWMDTNANGLQDGTELGVAGVTVSLLDGSGNPVNNPATGKPYVVTTDSLGNYKFVDLPAGSYQVKFSNIPAGTSFTSSDKSGSGAPGSGTDGTNDSDVNPATGKTATITLGAGQNITSVDAGLIPSVPAGKGSLGNKVWIDADNDGVQDANEQGVPNVTVELLFDSNGDGVISGTELTTPLKTTITDAQGNYLFTGLDAGVYQVNFVSSSFPAGYSLQAGKNDQGTDDALDSDPAPATGLTGVYTLAQGEDNLTVDAGIYNTTATNSIGDQVWIDTNSDGKKDAGEVGIAGVTVNLYDNTGKIIASVVTDGNGNYFFGNLPNGNYSVGVVPPAGYNLTVQNGTASGTTAANNSDFNATTNRTASVSLTGGTNITDLDAGLTTARAALGDKVWYDANGNGTQDGGVEVGISGVTVTLYRPGFGLDGIAGNGDDALPVATMITDANGNYLFSNLVPGTYEVAFTTVPSGLEFTQQNSAGDNQNNTNSDPVPSTGRTGGITLVAGETDLTVDAGLRPLQLGAVGDFVWFDSNNNGVQDAGEPGVPGIIVTLKDAGGNVIGTTITDGNGNYLFTNVPAGTGYTITFSNTPGGTSYTTQTNGTTNGSDANVGTGVTPAFTVTAGQINRDIDAGLLGFRPLPVQKLEATALLSGNSATISWITANEINTNRFYVERSIDNRSFTSIGDIAAAGNNPGTSRYNLSDNVAAFTGVVYYRIKLVDIDGKITYSNVVAVRINNKGMVSVFPNPFIEKINISVTSAVAERGTINIIDSKGQVVTKTAINLNRGASQVQVTGLSKLATGVYVIQLVSNSGVVTFNQTIVKQ